MKILGYTFLALILIAALLGLAFGLGILNLERRSYFEPRHAEIDRGVFENTPSYVHGKRTHLSRLRLDYITAGADAQRAALRQLILHEASTIDASLLPSDLNKFLDSIR